MKGQELLPCCEASPEHSRLARYAAEFIGTFFLVFTIECNVHNRSVGAAVSIGSMLMVMIYALGSVSGAHFNPAVTFAVRISRRGKLSTVDALAYVGSQMLGGILGALAYWLLVDGAFLLRPVGLYSTMDAVGSEVFFSCALCYVVLNVATTTAERGNVPNHYSGLAVGMTVTAAAIAAGPISGAVLNPAVSVGSTAAAYLEHGSVSLRFYWPYFLSPFVGAILAFLAFYLVRQRYEYADGVVLAPAPTPTQPPRLPPWDQERAHATVKTREVLLPPKAPREEKKPRLEPDQEADADVSDGEMPMGRDRPVGSSPKQRRKESPKDPRRESPKAPVQEEAARLSPPRTSGPRILQRQETVDVGSLGKDVESHDLFAGISWRVALAQGGAQGVDIDASCVKFDRNGTSLGAVYFAEKKDHINNMEHSGDQVMGSMGEGPADVEKITMNLSQIQRHVHALFFVATIFSSNSISFQDVPQFAVRLVDATQGNKELLRYEKKDVGSGNALVVAMLFRHGSGWCFRAVDECHKIQDHGTYRSLEPQLQKLWRQTLEVMERH